MKNKVRELRTKKNITQNQLAEMLNVSRQTIFAIETAMYIPSTVLALKIARVFKKNVEEIFELEKKD
ncbi:MAG: helix-turn-helix transcriptional regulator [Bacteroidetes bacterium]|nr:helix-turn-helix transcriptional regulator [Bacteroidota bacterium]MBS1634193.1 helix-turn-helix transcriptional regulator [Bacteroidota bacterium]